MSPALPLSHGPTPSQTALQHTQLMLTGSQLAGVRQIYNFRTQTDLALLLLCLLLLCCFLNTLSFPLRLPLSVSLFSALSSISSPRLFSSPLCQLTALLPAQQQLLLQQAQAQLLAAAVQQSSAAHAAHAAHAAAQANQQAQAAAAANQQAQQQQQQAGQTGQQAQSQSQGQGQSTQEQTGQSVPVPPPPPQLTLSQPIQLTAQVLTANQSHFLMGGLIEEPAMEQFVLRVYCIFHDSQFPPCMTAHTFHHVFFHVMQQQSFFLLLHPHLSWRHMTY